MPSQEPARSPSRRPHLIDRPSSSNSITKASPKGAQLLTAHKGSSTRLHKGHAVGHGRPTHNRVSSHGRNLNKLSRLGQGNVVEDGGNTRHHKRTSSHTPSTSPSDLSSKRNSSNISLHRPSSKGKVKRNASHTGLAQNGNISKLGNQSKSEKSQLKKNLLKQQTDDSPLRGTAQFELADDDEWTEDSGSQSPATTRTHSRPKTPVTPAALDLSTPDEPPGHFSPQLPTSPPESPKQNGNGINHSKIRHKAHDPYKNGLSHPPDAQDVSSRLLNRNGIHAIPAQTSKISANVTPHHIGSPKLSQSSASTSTAEPSMPADGISRFLSRTISNSDGGAITPGSISRLHQNLASFDHAPSPAPSSPRQPDTRRVQSAANLTQPHQSHDEDASPPSPFPPHDHSASPPIKSKKPYSPSPFESAKGANPRAGKSYTQLKQNLDREAVFRDPPISNHPLVGSHSNALNLSGTSSISMNPAEMAQRLRRQYATAKRDVASCRKYYPDIVTGKIPERAVRRHELGKGKDIKKAKERKSAGASSQSAASSAETGKSVGVSNGSVGGGDGGGGGGASRDGKRGRVRFEVGTPSRSAETETDEDRRDEEGVEGLLRRMWLAAEPTEVLEGD